MTATPYYDPKAPENTDSLAKSQDNFLQNFQSLFNTFGINHIQMNQSEQGMHNIIQLQEQVGGLQTNTNELNIYSKKVDGQTDQLFYRYQGNGQEIQITNYQLFSIDDNNFLTTLPGGFIVYFGSQPKLGSGSAKNLKAVKNIIGCAFCPMGKLGKAFSAPFVSFQKSNKDIPDINKLIMYSSSPKDNSNIEAQFYIVIGSIS